MRSVITADHGQRDGQCRCAQSLFGLRKQEEVVSKRKRRHAPRVLIVFTMSSALSLTLTGVAHADGTQQAISGAFGMQVQTPLLNIPPLPHAQVASREAAGLVEASVGIPEFSVPNLFDARLLRDEASAQASGEQFASARSDLAETAVRGNVLAALGVPIGNLIDAHAVRTSCRSDKSGSTGRTFFSDAVVADVQLVDANPGPNTRIAVADGLATVILNEQTVANETNSTSITVNGVHVSIPSLEIDIIIGQSHCEAQGSAIKPQRERARFGP